ncbi:MAG: RNA polymerase-binding protein DksA [Gammaproteobacteria bacterium]|jgi:DnaK suppressor protein
MAAKKKAAKTKAKAKSTAKKADSKSKAGAAKKAVAKKATAKKATAKSKTPTTRKADKAVKTAPTAKTRKPAASAVGPTQDIAPYDAGRDEEYMNEAQVEHFRNILLTWKRELMEEVDRTVHHMQDEAASFPDPNDRATQESEFSMELRARDRERKLIKKIDEALMNLDNDEYGYCEACGVEIGIRRLEARPTATLCIDCKTLDEIREKQMG